MNDKDRTDALVTALEAALSIIFEADDWNVHVEWLVETARALQAVGSTHYAIAPILEQAGEENE